MLALFVALAFVLTACSSSENPNRIEDDPYGMSDVGDCTPVVAAVSPEKLTMFKDLAKRFESSAEAKGLSKCVAVRPMDVSSGEAARLLKDGWSEGQTNKPKPTIWSPASTSWVEQVAASSGADLVPKPQSFARTPVVFAMPQVMAETLGWPDKPISMTDLRKLCLNPKGWGQYGGVRASWGGFKLGKTNPNTSTTGLNTLLMQSYAASGKQTGLAASDVTAAEQFSKDFESCVIHYGDTTGNILERVYAGASLDYISAIAVEETSVINYNLGNPNSKPVADGEVLTRPADKLVAIYPSEGSLESDNPTVVLGKKANWVSDEQRTAAQLFTAYLQKPEAQAVLPDYGFRPLDPKAKLGGLFTLENGVNPSLPAVTLEKPSVATTEAALTQWDYIRKPSSVLLLVDVSGSMKENAGTGRTLLAEAIEGARSTIGHFRSTDELGVWAFSSSNNGNIVKVREVSPLGDEAEDLRVDLGLLRPGGGTPMYDAIKESYDFMKHRAKPGRINAIVVLSDGEDSDSRTRLNDLLNMVQSSSGEKVDDSPVRIFPIIYSDAAPGDTLKQIAEGSGGQVFDASDPRRIKLIFERVINNF